MADELLKEGIYVIGFYYPVVPQGKAKVRVQIYAGHEREHLEKCVEAFGRVGKRVGTVGKFCSKNMKPKIRGKLKY